MIGGTEVKKQPDGYSHFKAPEKPVPALAKHARYSPSSMERLVHCNVSAFLAAGMPSEETEYSTEGTRAHELAELYLEKRLDQNKKPIPECAKDGIAFDAAMHRHCKCYANYCHAVVKDFLTQPHSWFIERRLVLDEDLDIWGTADFVFVYKDKKGSWHLILIDFKYGVGKKVVAEENWQLGTYSLAGLTTFEGEQAQEKFVDVDTHIFQPRSEHNSVPQLYDRQELIDFYAPKILEAVKRSEVWFNENFVSNEDIEKYQKAGNHCQFCRAKGICKAYANYHGVGNVLKLLGLAKPKLDALQQRADAEHKAAMSEYSAEKKLAKKEKREPEIEKPTKLNVYNDAKSVIGTGVFSPEDLAWIALNESKIAGFAEAAKDALKAELISGKKNPFVILGKASPTRAWIDDDAKVIAGLIAKGIEEPAEIQTKIISITEAEKILGEGQIGELTHVVRETVRLARIDEDVEPAMPRGLDVRAMLFAEKKK